MSGEYELTVTLTSAGVSAVAKRPPRGSEPAREDEAGPEPLDRSGRATIHVLQGWLGRWGLFTALGELLEDQVRAGRDPRAAELADRSKHSGVPVPETFQVLGEHLYRLAFPGSVGDLFDLTRGAATDDDKDMRVVLRLDEIRADDVWLTELPWEFLYRPKGERDGFFIAVTERLVLSRFLAPGRSEEPMPRAEPPLKIHFVSAIPPEMVVKVNAAYDLILAMANRPEVALPSNTRSWDPEEIGQTLAGRTTNAIPDIVHVVGVCRATGAGMEIDLRQVPEGASEEALVAVLTRAPENSPKFQVPRLVVLHLVEASPFDYAATFAGHARALARAGVPAVLAMQYPLPPARAPRFTQTFYKSLADGRPIDEAVRVARNEVARPEERDPLFGAPVLYLQRRDGQLVEPPAATPAPGLSAGVRAPGAGVGRRPGGADLPDAAGASAVSPLRASPVAAVPMAGQATGRPNAPDALARTLLEIASKFAPPESDAVVAWVKDQSWNPGDLVGAMTAIRQHRLEDPEAAANGPAYVEMIKLLQERDRGIA